MDINPCCESAICTQPFTHNIPVSSIGRLMSSQTLYHGTFTHEVDAIKAGIKLEGGKPPSDFNAKDRLRAFYLTPDKKSAELWAKARRDWAGSTAPVSVLEYILNTAGLRVHDFGTTQTGPEFEKWQQVSVTGSR